MNLSFCLLFLISPAEGDLTSPTVQLTAMYDSAQVVDLMQYTPLGGVLYYDVFHLPPQAHQVCGWEIRQVRKSVSVLLLHQALQLKSILLCVHVLTAVGRRAAGVPLPDGEVSLRRQWRA